MQITDLQCQDVTNLSEIIDVVDEAFKNCVLADMVPKTYLDCPDPDFGGDFRAMPGKIGDVAGIKWVSVFPKNQYHKLPTVLATILLNSASTGELLAILAATHITRLRTAAAAAVATRLLSNADSKVAAFIGCGAQTQLHVDAICKVRDIQELRFFDLNEESLELMCSANNKTESAVRKTDIPTGIVVKCHGVPCSSVEECVSGADIVTTLTPSTKPVVKGAWLSEGVHINAMGADAEGKREFDNATYKMVDMWAYDDWAQASHSGETQHAYKSRNGGMACMPWPKNGESKLIGLLTEFLGRSTKEQITLFDSTGVAIQDIAVANYIYEKLREQ